MRVNKQADSKGVQYLKSSQKLSCISKIDPEGEPETILNQYKPQPTILPEYLHLIPSINKESCQFNSNRLIASCKHSIASDELVVIGSEIMSSDYYEKYKFNIICPISCANISIGLITIENLKTFEQQKKKKEVLDSEIIIQKFKTTTSRNIGVYVNFTNKLINFSLNDNNLSSKSQKILDVKYKLIIKIKDAGNLVVLNPFESLETNKKVSEQTLKIEEEPVEITHEQNVQESGDIIYLNNSVIYVKNNQVKQYIQDNGKIDIDCRIDQKQLQQITDKVILKFQNNDFDYLKETLKEEYKQVKSIELIKNEVQEIEHIRIDYTNAINLLNGLDQSKSVRGMRMSNYLGEQLYMLCNDHLRQQIGMRMRKNSEYLRLQTFIGYKGQLDISLLAKVGVIQQSDLLAQLAFCESKQPSNLVLDNRQDCLSQLKQQVSWEEKQAFLQKNVPLSISINSMPYNQLYSKMKLYSLSNDRLYLTIVDLNNNIRVYYVAKWLKQVLEIQNKKWLNLQEENRKAKLCQIDKDSIDFLNDYSHFGNMYDLEDEEAKAQEVLKKEEKQEKKQEIEEVIEQEGEEGEEEEEEGEEEEGEEGEEEEEKKEEKALTANKQLVEQIYMMGFSIELAEKAVIKTNNKGISEALDVMMELQKEMGQQQSQQTPKKIDIEKKIIKNKWQCTVCTLINTNGKTNCEACEIAAPEEAYEIVKQEQSQQEQQNIDKQNQEKEQQKIKEEDEKKEKEEKEKEEADKKQKEEECRLLEEKRLRQIKEDASIENINMVHLEGENGELMNLVLILEDKEYLVEIQRYSMVQTNEIEKEMELLFKLRGYQQIQSSYRMSLECQKVGAMCHLQKGDSLHLFIQVDTFIREYTIHINNNTTQRIQQYSISNQVLSLFTIDNHSILIVYKDKTQILNLDDFTMKEECLLDQEIQKVEQVNTHKYILINDQQHYSILQLPISESIGSNDCHQQNSMELIHSNNNNQLHSTNQKQQHNQTNSMTLIQNTNYEIESKVRYIQNQEQSMFFLDPSQTNCETITIYPKSICSQILIAVDQQPPQEVPPQTIQQECPLVGMSNTQWMLSNQIVHLNIVQFQGSQQCAKIRVGRILDNNEQVFQSNYSNTYYLFEQLQQQYMDIQSVSLGSNKKLQQGGYAIGEAYIFLLDFPSEVEGIIKDRLNHNQYSILSGLPQYAGRLSFSADNQLEASIQLNHQRIARYLLMLPTKNRQPLNKNFNTHPLEIQYFIVQGQTIDKQSYYNTHLSIPNRVTHHNILDYLDITLDGQIVNNVNELNLIQSIHKIQIVNKKPIDTITCQLFTNTNQQVPTKPSSEMVDSMLNNGQIEMVNLMIQK